MRWRERARRLKVELVTLSYAARHPRTPWYAKLAVAGLVVYAVTPVDFVPDAGRPGWRGLLDLVKAVMKR